MNVGVLFHRLKKAGRAVFALFLRVYLRLQGGDFLFQRKLFIVIAFGNHHKTLVGELSACVVLVGFGEKAVQFGTAGQHGPKFPRPALSVLLGLLHGLGHQELDKTFLFILQKGCHAPDFQKHHLFQRVRSDVMGRIAGAAVALIVGAVEILEVGVRVVDIEIELAPAVGAIEKAGKHILFHRLWRSPFCTFPDTLHHFPCLTVNNPLMDALENRMIFLRVFVAPLILEGFGVGLEVYHIPHIFAGVEDFIDCGLAPIVGAVFERTALFSASADTLAFPVFRGSKDLLLFQSVCYAVFAQAIYTQFVDIAHDFGRVLVHDPAFWVCRVFYVPVQGLR